MFPRLENFRKVAVRFLLFLLFVTAHTVAEAAVTHDVEIRGFEFVPAELTITQGDVVRFTNRSTGLHTVTGDEAMASAPELIRLPQGAQPFHSILRPQQTFEHQFNVPGDYTYICNPHASMGMVGQIQVK